jgi:hypothetical protein
MKPLPILWQRLVSTEPVEEWLGAGALIGARGR